MCKCLGCAFKILSCLSGRRRLIKRIRFWSRVVECVERIALALRQIFYRLGKLLRRNALGCACFERSQLSVERVLLCSNRFLLCLSCGTRRLGCLLLRLRIAGLLIRLLSRCLGLLLSLISTVLSLIGG